jgi:hypothetical protein
MAGGKRKSSDAASGFRWEASKWPTYVQIREFGFILLVTVWGKNEKSDLSVRDRNAIAAMVREIRRAMAARWKR